jgi:hypothetical protein
MLNKTNLARGVTSNKPQKTNRWGRLWHVTNSSGHPSGPIMARNKPIRPPVGADLSRPPPIYRPSPDGLLPAST